MRYGVVGGRGSGARGRGSAVEGVVWKEKEQEQACRAPYNHAPITIQFDGLLTKLTYRSLAQALHLVRFPPHITFLRRQHTASQPHHDATSSPMY